MDYDKFKAALNNIKSGTIPPNFLFDDFISEVEDAVFDGVKYSFYSMQWDEERKQIIKVEKKDDEEINEEMGFSDSTRKRKLKDAYLQFAFQLGIVKYNNVYKSFDCDPYTEKILDFCIKPKTRNEIQDYCEINSRPYFSQTYLKPLLDEGKLLMLYPNKPKSKHQRYYTNQKN